MTWGDTASGGLSSQQSMAVPTWSNHKTPHGETSIWSLWLPLAQLSYCTPPPPVLTVNKTRGPSEPSGSHLGAARAPRASPHFSSFQNLEQRLLRDQFPSAPGLCKAELASPRGWRLLGARAVAEPRMLPQVQTFIQEYPTSPVTHTHLMEPQLFPLGR